MNVLTTGASGRIPLTPVRPLLALTLLCAGLAPGGAAYAQKPEERTAFELGARAGVSFPFGQASAGKNLSDLVGPAFPFTFEAGVRLFGRYELAAVGQYAIGTVNSTSSSGCYTGSNACTSSIGQIGVEFLYHPLGLARIDPFIGVGLGYEWLVVRATVQKKNYDLALGGWNWAVVQGGVEFPVGKLFRVGPYALVSVGQYVASDYTVPTANGPVSGSSPIANPAVHLWLSVGIRMVVLP
jgi:hypothetical protein